MSTTSRAALGSILGTVVIVAFFGLIAFAVTPSSPRHSVAGSAVKIIITGANGKETAHGSGVILAGDYIITAAHVVADAKDGATILTDAGISHHATVLWASKDYDVALLRFEASPDDIAPAPLACRTPALGEHVRTVGNPLTQDFITSWGRVGGASRKTGPWAVIIELDMTVAPGNSGGPVYDEAGNVVAIIVGMFAVPNMLGSSPLAMTAAVPASAICMLMARA